MNQKILIVEDQFIEANNLQMILERAGYRVCSIAHSVPVAMDIIAAEKPDLVLLDIYLQGPLTGIDLAHVLKQKNIAFVYLSANSNAEILEAAKATRPYGFLVKPFREKDVLVTLDIAYYLHEHSLEASLRREPGLPRVNQSVPPDLGMAAALSNSNQAPLFEGIIGRSACLQQVLNLLQVVAPSETSVLILGENGTGKEKIAQLIHTFSPRKTKPLVKVNCAALPASLIESELFGHEKGSFTGATDRRIGRFEQAEGGTIFLDEIGEMPLDLQVKLLRVLQEKEIERIGGRNTIRINVRIIAATNRNLEEEVAGGRFRIDLYYRLNVFPITMPPLRERKEDIPLLAAHFLKQHAGKAGNAVMGISDKALKSLMDYHWPGNIRELENLIVRSALLSPGTIIDEIPLPPTYRDEAALPRVAVEYTKTMEENERDHILLVLEKCDGKVAGPDGAAHRLGIPVSTLTSRMKKLGIKIEKQFGKST
ncbi:MAG: sigma-54-dependent Fis family transcriptional regulator [Cytophagales bacterium]|nr:sigma-54-dependent Fis family transcriptional regulator [Cytophagales bacterium]